MEKSRKMENQKESKLNWVLTVVDSEEAPVSDKISGKTSKWGFGVGRKRQMCSYVLVTFRLSKVLNAVPRCFIYEVFILNIFFY